MTLSGIVVKAAGLLFKIPLTSLIGEEGMGYFNSAYTLFTWVYMLSCAGLPTAASMMIAKLPYNRREDGAKRIFRISLALFALLGTVGGALLYFGAEPIARLMRVESSAVAISAIAPTLAIITVSSALRGYFQGLGELIPHSVSQVIEAVGKAVFGIILAHFAVESGRSIPEAAAFAALGITLGVFCGTAVLSAAYFIRKKISGDIANLTWRSTATNLLKTALPVTLSSSVMSLANLIDSFIMTRSLHASGLSQSECAAIWGNYSSLAVPMFNLPPVLTMPIAYALLPMLASALAVGDKEQSKKLTGDAARRTAFLAIPCAVGLSAMSEPILKLLFEDNVAERGAMLLTLLAPSTVLLCMLSLFNTVLQASGHERLPLIAMLSGAILKLITTWLLTPHIGAYATPVSTFICYLAACTVALLFITRKTELGCTLGISVYLKPTVIAALAVTAAVIAYPFVGTFVSVGIAAVAYFGLSIPAGMLKKVK